MSDARHDAGMADDPVLLAVADRVATITLNRPDARNALSSEVLSLLPSLMTQADSDDDVDVIVLTGADPAFCAGLDLKELGTSGGNLGGGAGADGSRNRTGVRGPFPRLGKPLIGAINGVAVTGGLELVLACDFLVASERARFADTHARVGIMPGWGLTVLLPAAVGVRRAKELSTTGNFLDAETALAWGLVNHVVPHEELLPFCRRLGHDVASIDPVAVRRMLQTYDEGSLRDGAGAWALEAEVAAAWQGEGLDPAALEASRRAVIARGRTQL
jgi:enoyl-CoA hydratase